MSVTQRTWTPASSRRLIAVTGALAVAVAAAVVWHAGAWALFSSAGRPGMAAERLRQAREAARLEPFNERFAWRVVTLHGRELLERGRVDDAYRLLEPYAGEVRGDPLFRRVYQDVLRIKAPLDSRKAHLQHAREQTGGVLREEDVFK